MTTAGAGVSRSIAAEFTIRHEDSLAFARLSGDYNPLHVDRVYARRTPFGDTVVHGIHLLLKSLDEVARTGEVAGLAPLECSVTFSNPVHTGVAVELTALFDASTGRLRLTGSAQGRAAYSATIMFGQCADAPHVASCLDEDLDFPPATPRLATFPPPSDASALPVRLGRKQMLALLPALATAANAAWIVDLLASTRLIGMECPGMHSIYSGCKLKIYEGGDQLSYRVVKLDERFKLVKQEIQGRYFRGTLEAFFRAPPVTQPSLAEVCAHVPATAYAGHHALVVGGSRGLGELAAKCVLAGGGRVTLTYARGRDDAKRICDEARALQRDCDATELELAALLGRAAPPDWIAAGGFTHVYFFASPRIAKGRDDVWDAALFAQFADAYVNAFAGLVRAIAPTATPRSGARFLYPSTIFVTQPEKGLAEYAAAKAAGEAMCEYLSLSCGTKIQRPQLPRMKTDQTSGLPESKLQDPLPIMLDVVRRLHAND